MNHCLGVNLVDIIDIVCLGFGQKFKLEFLGIKFDEIFVIQKIHFLSNKKIREWDQNKGGYIKHNHKVISINTLENKVSSVDIIDAEKNKKTEFFDKVISTTLIVYWVN